MQRLSSNSVLYATIEYSLIFWNYLFLEKKWLNLRDRIRYTELHFFLQLEMQSVKNKVINLNDNAMTVGEKKGRNSVKQLNKSSGMREIVFLLWLEIILRENNIREILVSIFLKSKVTVLTCCSPTKSQKIWNWQRSLKRRNFVASYFISSVTHWVLLRGQ